MKPRQSAGSISEVARDPVRRDGEALALRVLRISADLEAFLASPDPLGPEDWQAVQEHIRDHGVYMGERVCLS